MTDDDWDGRWLRSAWDQVFKAGHVMRTDVDAFLAECPWLADLGDDILGRLSTEDWAVPGDPEARARRRELEQTLEAHVMAYRREAQGLADALALLVEPAELTPDQLALIQAAETTTKDYVFVAFSRPLRRRQHVVRARRVNRRTRKD